jgi:alpha-glucoside transport system substrate-binding protein
MSRRSPGVVALVTGSVALVLAACGGGSDEAGGGGDGSIEIVGAIGGANAEALQLEIAKISEETGIDVTYTTIPDFDTVIQTRVRGNNSPDLAVFPQPGVLLDLQEDMVPLDDLVDVEAVTSDMIPGLAEIAQTEEGSTYGLPWSINVKSNVWYPVTEFDDAGYEVPASHQELLELTDQIKSDGTPPWCFAFEAQAATGWYVTDWIEEYVLRIGGPEVYDQWVSHEILFTDPVVVEAAEAFEELVLSEGNAVLSRDAMAATPWGDALQPLVEDPAGCFMARQGNFVIGFWPPEVQEDPSQFVSSFLLPPYEGGWDGGQAVLGGGDLVAAFSDNEDVRTVLEAILTPEFGTEWAGAENNEFVSPYATFESSAYLSETVAQIADAVSEADAFRFDGSDLMPGQVGSGAFWTEMTAWVTGQTDLETALTNIDAAWPTA